MISIHINKTVWLFCFSLIFLIASCAGTQFVPREVYQDAGVSVNLVSKKDSSGNIVSKGFDHPWQVETKTLEKLLASVVYTKGIAVFNEHPSPAFPEKQLEILAPQLRHAFSMATPSQYIEFSFVFPKYSGVFKREFVTDGFLFHDNGALNCAFKNIAFDKSLEVLENVYIPMNDSSYDPFTGDPTADPVRGSWQIVPGPGQSLAVVEKGGMRGEVRYDNWVKLDVARIAQSTGEADSADDPGGAAPAEKESVTPAEKEAGQPAEKERDAAVSSDSKPAPPSDTPKDTRKTIEENLRFLETLYKEGLISKVAYEKKKRALLEKIPTREK